MNRLRCVCFVAAGLLLLGVSQASAIAILSPDDAIIAIDETFVYSSASNYPSAESPAMLLDANSGTKYLNFAEENCGFIVTPVSGASIVQSFMLTTANDAVERDPASWALYGTNDAIASANNSLGNAESWALIGSGDLALPDARQTMGSVVSFANADSYTSYKMVFPTVKNASSANSMQLADVYLYQSGDGTGSSVLSASDAILAIDTDIVVVGASSYPTAEAAKYCIDGNTSSTKYLNFGEEGSGFIVTPKMGSMIVQSFQITTANDYAVRDPASWSLYGTNDAIASADNGDGKAESWTLIDSGTLSLPDARYTAGDIVAVNNSTAYTSYKMVFPTVKDAASANCMQIEEIQFYGGIPEPSTFVLLAGLVVAGAAWCRRRASR